MFFSQIYTVYHLLRQTHYILFSDIQTISTSQKYTLYTVLRNAHYILFSDNTLYSLHRNAQYILFQENTLYPLHRNTHYILLKKYTLYPLLRKTHHILLKEIHILSSCHKYIFSFQINTLYPVRINLPLFSTVVPAVIFVVRLTGQVINTFKYHVFAPMGRCYIYNSWDDGGK